MPPVHTIRLHGPWQLKATSVAGSTAPDAEQNAWERRVRLPGTIDLHDCPTDTPVQLERHFNWPHAIDQQTHIQLGIRSSVQWRTIEFNDVPVETPTPQVQPGGASSATPSSRPSQPSSGELSSRQSGPLFGCLSEERTAHEPDGAGEGEPGGAEAAFAVSIPITDHLKSRNCIRLTADRQTATIRIAAVELSIEEIAK